MTRSDALQGSLPLLVLKVLARRGPLHALKTSQGSKDSPHSIDRRFLRRLQKVDKLSTGDKKLLLGTIDAFLSKVS